MSNTTKSGLIKPNKLNHGDKVVAISLSFGAANLFPDRFKAGCAVLENNFGLEVVPSQHALKDPDWLSNNPKARAEDLIESLEDSSVKGIICTIGGEDSIRVNQHIDLDIIRNNPKVFMGYSDATTTHSLFLNAGVVSFYGPTIMAGFAENGGLPEYVEDTVRRCVFENDIIGEIKPNTVGWTSEFLDWAIPENQNIKRKLEKPNGPITIQGQGKVTGHLMGGCVEVLEMLRGTDQWPNDNLFDGSILFLETAEKEFLPIYYKRALRSYAVMGIFDKVKAIMIGRPGGNVSVEQMQEYHDGLLSVVRDEFGYSELPMVVNMDFGHTDPIMTLPYGVKACLDCETGVIDILESAVV